MSEQERSLVSAPALRDGAVSVLAVIGRAYLVIDEVGGGGSGFSVHMRWVWCVVIRWRLMGWRIRIRMVRHRGILRSVLLRLTAVRVRGAGPGCACCFAGDEYILVLAG